MNTPTLSATLLAFALLGAAEPTPPVAAPAEPAALTVPLAIQLALAGNETAAISQAQIDKAQAGVQAAWAALRPQVDLSGKLSATRDDNLPAGAAANQSASWQAGAHLALFDPKAWSGTTVAQYRYKAAIQTASDLRRQLTFTVVDVYLSILAAEKQVTAAARRREVATSAVGDAKARLQAGLTTRTDVTRAELSLAEAELGLTRAHRAVTASRLALADLIVRPIDGPLALPETIPLPERNGKVLYDIGRAFRPDLKALQYNESAADWGIRAERSRYVPKLGASASLAQERTNARPTDSDAVAVEVALNATWSLYDGGLREADIASAQADRRDAGLTRTQQLRGLRKDLDTALADLSTAEAVVAQAEARDRLARANAEEIRARYKQGLSTALEDADAISSQFEAESNLVSAQLDLERSKLALRQLVGWWPLSDREPEPAQP